MFCASALENSANKLRLARCYKYELQLNSVLSDELIQLFRADKFTIREFCLKEQKIPVIFII